MLGRAKSCRWQVFVRRRPPKQGELRTDVSKATMFQGDRAAKKAHEVCRPGRDELSIGKFQSFCPTFCTLQKVGKRSRRKAAQKPRSGKRI